ncbi:MAG: hypothetical protein LPK38_05590, partial [Actinomycetes bacterium]|nr:hypothetical protein [Actinomycetes bacterium]MDX5380766.1 hypothetical protein [Actinomycetes bacterium]MDX5399781.1 hypothetical protein [Actinomycetes bacterium]MDX5450506.1 hypothetical protein [Actinomycetes bacterium]
MTTAAGGHGTGRRAPGTSPSVRSTPPPGRSTPPPGRSERHRREAASAWALLVPSLIGVGL